MSTFNEATLLGNVGSDPELRSTTGGGRVATLSLATSEKWTDAKGQPREKTEWHRVVFWNTSARKLADLVERYVTKGDKLLVKGKIEYKQWQDRDGQTRYSTEINGQHVTFLTSKQTKDARPAAAAAPAAAPAAVGAPAQVCSPAQDEYEPSDDDAMEDLPF